MRRLLLVLLVMLLLGVPAAMAETLLYDWTFNLNGTLYQSPGAYSGPAPGQLPASFNTAGFDWTTGMGSIVVDYRPGTGVFYFASFFDLEIDTFSNGYTNEYGAVFGTPGAGQSWEIDEPGWNSDPSYPMGDIYGHVLDYPPTLENINNLPISIPFDPAMALAWAFILGPNERALIHLYLTPTPPAGGFYMQQIDIDSGGTLYFSSSIEITDLPTPIIPEPATLVLLGSGSLLLRKLGRRRT